MSRCRNCSHYRELAAPGTGTCPIGADPPAMRKIAAADPGCPEFTLRPGLRRRTTAPVKPSADAVLIAEAIAGAAERVAQAIASCLIDPEGGTVKDSLSDLAVIAERVADHLET